MFGGRERGRCGEGGAAVVQRLLLPCGWRLFSLVKIARHCIPVSLKRVLRKTTDVRTGVPSEAMGPTWTMWEM